jgi:AcrR family transcriptional regulator
MAFQVATLAEAPAGPSPGTIYFRALDAEPWRHAEPRGAAPQAASSYQQARLMHAMAEAVAEKGYANVTVTDVVASAGASRRTFYEHFSDKEQCFLETYEQGSRAVADEVLAVFSTVDIADWRGRVRTGLEAFTEVLAAEPAVARTLMVDALGAGPQAVELRRKTMDGFAALFTPAAPEDLPEDAEEPPRARPEFVRGLVGAITELVQEQILTEGAETLPSLAPTLFDLALSVLEAGRTTEA